MRSSNEESGEEEETHQKKLMASAGAAYMRGLRRSSGGTMCGLMAWWTFMYWRLKYVT